MSEQNKDGYLLLFSGNEWYQELSLAEIHQVVKQNKAWYDGLAAQGKIKGGQALVREGTIVSGKGSRLMSDGPFAESKEAIGGTLLLDVATLEEAIAIARTSPSLAHNTTIEVRPIADACPIEAGARQKAQELVLAAA